jgi:diacylglycerol kinase family enzyme
VASVAMRHDLAYVCVPAGTRNHLALDLGLDRGDVLGALDAFGEAAERQIDLARVGDRIFVNNASLGVYAVAVQSEGYREAKVGTITQKLPELLGPGASRLDLRFVGPDGRPQAGAHLILVSNDPYRLAHLDGFGSRVGMESGLLGVVVVSIPSPAAAAQLVALESMGQVRRFSGWQEWTGERFTIDSAGPVAVGVDGEALSLAPPLEFASLPKALRVRLPGAARRSPAARAVQPRDAPGLIRAALGVGSRQGDGPICQIGRKAATGLFVAGEDRATSPLGDRRGRRRARARAWRTAGHSAPGATGAGHGRAPRPRPRSGRGAPPSQPAARLDAARSPPPTERWAASRRREPGSRVLRGVRPVGIRRRRRVAVPAIPAE